MQKLKIINYGQLQNVEIEVKDFLLLTGPQGGNLHSICSLITFFKSLRDDAVQYIIQAIQEGDFSESLQTFKTLLEEKFFSYFSPEAEYCSVSYSYLPRVSIHLEYLPGSKSLQIDFSDQFCKQFLRLVDNLRANIEARKSDSANWSGDFFSVQEQEILLLRKTKESVCAEIFADEKDLFYATCNRSMPGIVGTGSTFTDRYVVAAGIEEELAEQQELLKAAVELVNRRRCQVLLTIRSAQVLAPLKTLLISGEVERKRIDVWWVGERDCEVM